MAAIYDRPRRHGRRAAPLAVSAGVVLVVAALVGALARPAWADEPPKAGPGARAAIVVDAASGAVLYERDSHEELAPASLTKMVTALVAIERASLDEPVQTTHAYNVVPVVIGLEPGDSLPLEAALYGLLLNSGNDAALAIAESVADGSTSKFVGWMNDLSRRLGLSNTQFRNPHGLDQDGHVSSAYDMAIVGRALMQQPVLAKIVGTGRHEYEGPPRWVFRTRIPIFGIYSGLDGIKTGFDDNAGLCLVATAIRDDRRAIAVVMNSPNYGAEAASLLDYAFADDRWGPRPPAAATSRPAVTRVAMLRADLSGTGDGVPSSMLRASGLSASIGGWGAP